MSYIYLQIKNDTTKQVIRREDVTDKSENVIRFILNSTRAEFDDKFNLENSIGVIKSIEPLPIIDDKIKEYH